MMENVNGEKNKPSKNINRNPKKILLIIFTPFLLFIFLFSAFIIHNQIIIPKILENKLSEVCLQYGVEVARTASGYDNDDFGEHRYPWAA